MTGFTRSKTVGAFLGRYDAIYQHLPPLSVTDNVSVDEMLARWAVYGGSKRPSPLRGLYQRIVLLLTSIVYVRSIVLALRPFIAPYITNKSFWYLWYDFFPQHTPASSLDYYNSAHLFVAQYTFFIALYCYRKRKHESRWNWVKFFSIFQDKVTPGDLMITEAMTHSLWRELRFTVNLCNILCSLLVTVAVSFLVYCNVHQLMQMNVPAVTWCIILSLWSYYAAAYIIGFLCLFRFICIYIDMRIRKLTIDSFLLSQHAKEITEQDIGHVLYSLLSEFDFTCRELDRFNKFWRFYILVFYGPGFIYIFFALTLLIVKGGAMAPGHLVTCGLIFITALCLWTYSVLLAGMIPSRSKKLYANLNKVCVLTLPAFIIPKLDVSVKRFGGRAISFDCYQMFYITHEFLYEVVLFSGTSYVLLIDAIIRSMQ